MSSNIKSIVNEDVNNKVVILRADLNIPIEKVLSKIRPDLIG